LLDYTNHSNQKAPSQWLGAFCLCWKAYDAAAQGVIVIVAVVATEDAPAAVD
jgi:hypothetical protein